jgi:hypothetical protein
VESEIIPPSQITQASYGCHWEKLKTLNHCDPEFDVSWDEILRLEGLYNWVGLLRNLRTGHVLRQKIAG